MHLICPQNFVQAFFSISFGTAVIPRRNEKQRLSKILVDKHGVLWEMCFLLAREEVQTVKEQLVVG